MICDGENFMDYSGLWENMSEKKYDKCRVDENSTYIAKNDSENETRGKCAVRNYIENRIFYGCVS